MIKHLVVRAWLAPLEWRIWPVYAPKADPGAVYLGPLIVRWHWDWT